jgi:hypothetical protein
LITGITIGVIVGIFIHDKGYEPHQINPPPRPEHFYFIFTYGPGAKNVLNTINGTYTWDMVIGQSVTINMTLTEDDLDRILRKMIEINFFDFPEVFVVPRKDVYGYVEPFDRYRFFVEYRGFKKSVKWDAEEIYRKRNNEATALKELCDLIIEIIESKPEYKNLPKPRGGYL